MDASAYAAIIIAIAMSIIAYGAYIIGKKNDKFDRAKFLDKLRLYF